MANDATTVVTIESQSLRIDAMDIVKEIQYAVESAEISYILPRHDNLIYINLKTIERDTYCVELSIQGFCVVSKTFDTIENLQKSPQYYETIYALLDAHSPQYRKTFGEVLINKLSEIEKSQ